MLLEIEENFIPCISDALMVSRVRTAGGTQKLAYFTDTGTYIRLNDDAVKFLELCDGVNTVGDIIKALRREYSEDFCVKEVVMEFMAQLREAGIIQFLRTKRKEPRKINSEVKLFSPLQHVYMEVTNACNLKCKHCYNNSGQQSEYELTTEEIKRVVDEIAKLSVFNVILTGGEPLLRGDLFEIIKYIRKKPMSVTVFTNATLVNEDYVNKLKSCEVLRVLVSLDGAHAKTHDVFRGVDGAFERAINAIRMMTREGLHVIINICINKFNKNEIPQLLKLLKNLGVDDYIAGPLYSAGRADGRIGELGIDINEYRKIVREIRLYEKRFFGREKIFIRQSSFSHCGIGMRSIVIKADGTVVPCVSADPEKFYLGNIRKESLKRIWNNSGLLNKLREIDMKANAECGGCAHFNFCKGGCRINAYQIFHDVTKPDPYACVYYSCVANDVITLPVEEDRRIEFEVR